MVGAHQQILGTVVEPHVDDHRPGPDVAQRQVRLTARGGSDDRIRVADDGSPIRDRLDGDSIVIRGGRYCRRTAAVEVVGPYRVDSRDGGGQQAYVGLADGAGAHHQDALHRTRSQSAYGRDADGSGPHRRDLGGGHDGRDLTGLDVEQQDQATGPRYATGRVRDVAVDHLDPRR